MHLFKEQAPYPCAAIHGKMEIHPLIMHAIDTLNERLSWFQNPLQRVLVMGHLSKMLYTSSPLLQKASVHYEAIDKDYDCVISFFHMDRVNDIAQYLYQIQQSLKPGGVFMAVFLGGSTFLNLKNLIMSYEIESISGASLRVHPTIRIADAIHLLQQAGFACPLADGDNIHFTFETVYQLIKTLRSLGGTNQLIKTPKPFDRHTARALLDHPTPFHEKFDYIYLTGLNPHTKPLLASKPEDFSVSCQ